MESVYDMRTLVFRVLLVSGYLCLGSGIFYILEQDQGSFETIKRMDRNYNNTMKKILKRWIANDSKLDQIMMEIRTTFRLHSSPKPWNFKSGMNIALQTMTTIGYGNEVPKTLGGRMFLILYATVGIPLMAMMLTTIGEKTKHFIKSRIALFERKVLKRSQPQNIHLKSLMTVSVTTVIFLLVVSLISSVIEENWSFPLALYVWFVTFTTIGFGDYVPAGSGDQSMLPLELVYSIISFFLGLSLIATILHTLGDWINSKTPPTKEALKQSMSRMISMMSKQNNNNNQLYSSEFISDNSNTA